MFGILSKFLILLETGPAAGAWREGTAAAAAAVFAMFLRIWVGPSFVCAIWQLRWITFLVVVLQLSPSLFLNFAPILSDLIRHDCISLFGGLRAV